MVCSERHEETDSVDGDRALGAVEGVLSKSDIVGNSVSLKERLCDSRKHLRVKFQYL